MSGSVTVLSLKTPPALRVDLRHVSPSALAGLSVAEIERLAVPHGNRLLPLAEWFTVTRRDGRSADAVAGAPAAMESATAPVTNAAPDADGGPQLRFEGDLSRCDRIGWQLAAGRIVVEGDAGHYVGACMTGGSIAVHGDGGDLVACEMAGGRLTVDGNVGDFTAGTLPGSLDGMRGGVVVVRGNAGARFGDRMRRGSLLLHGDAGDFMASRMVAGTLAIGGSAGAHVGYGMRRGSVVFAGPAPAAMPATFVPLIAESAVFWQLLARDLARHGRPFAGLPGRRIERHAGDLSAAGKGELIVAA